MKKISCCCSVAIAFTLLSGNVIACEKWKSEIGSTVWNVGKYIKVYKKYTDNNISQSEFRSEANEAIEKLETVVSRTLSISSCTHPDNKYENRKESLSSTIDFALPIMKAGEFLAENVKEKLNNVDEDND